MDTKHNGHGHSGTLQLRDPADLRLHPLQKHLPEPDKQSPEWLSFIEGLQNAGPEGVPPLVITREGYIMDGGRRWRGAKQLQWEQVKVEERPEHEAAALIVQSLLGQRNLPRGTKVYLTLTLLPDFVKSAEHRRLDNLKRGVKNGQKPFVFPKGSDATSETVGTFCAILGVDRSTYSRAVRVRELFDEHPHFRTEYEADLLSGEKSLWNVESAIKGALGDQSKRESSKDKNQLELFTDGLEALAKAGKFWTRFDDDKKESVRTAWRKTIKAMPAELRRQLQDELEELT